MIHKSLLTLMVSCLATELFAAQDPATVRQALLDRLERLQNVIVKYQYSETYIPDRPDEVKVINGRRTTTVFGRGTQTSDREFSFLNGQARYDTTYGEVSPGGAGRPSGSHEMCVVSRDRVDTLRPEGPSGNLDSLTRIPQGRIGVVLGLQRSGSPSPWITADWLWHGELTFPDDQRAVLTWSADSRTESVWVFDRTLGYAPVLYQERKPDAAKTLRCEVVMSDFQPVEGMMLPRAATFRNFWSRPHRLVSNGEVKIRDYRFKALENRPSRYVVVWPAGARIIDHRAGIMYEVLASGHVFDDRKIDPKVFKPIRTWSKQKGPDSQPGTPVLQP